MSNEGRPRYGGFVAWTAVGAGACLALLTLLTIGVFVLVAVGVLLFRWAARGRGSAPSRLPANSPL